MADGSIIIDSKIDKKQFEKDIDSISKKMDNAGKKMQKAGGAMTLGVTTPILGIGAAMGKSAMDLEATEAKYNTVFKGMTGQVDDYINEFQKLTPATEAEARSMASGIQDLLVPMGFTREAATEMTGDFIHLTGALTNFNSATHSAEDVSAAFQSAVTGQYDSLKRLGIQASAATVEQKAMEIGLVKADEEMTAQAKTQALLALAYDQSGDALAGYTEDNLDATTKSGLLKAELTDTAAMFGQMLLPAITMIIDKVRGFIEILSALTPQQQQLIINIMLVLAVLGPLLMIVGKIVSIFSILGPIIGAIGAPIILIVAAVVALIAIFVHLYKTNETVRDTINAVWENIKEMFGAVMEVIKEVIGAAIEAIQKFWEDHGEQIIETLTSIFDAIKEIVSLAIEAIKLVIEKVLGIIKAIWDKWGDAIKKVWSILWDGLKNTAMNMFNTIKSVIEGVFMSIKGIFSAVTSALRGDWRGFWKAMGDIVKGPVNVIIGLVNGVISAIENMVNAVAKGVNSLPEFSVPKWIPGIGGKKFGLPNIPTLNLPKIPAFDVGTDRITRDGLALLHKDEMVVPAAHTGPYTGNGQGVKNEFNISQLVVREESDIRKIARELRQMQLAEARG